MALHGHQIRRPDNEEHAVAYARLVIREAQRHGGVGWLDYNRVFRQQAALDSTMQWNTAATLTGRMAKPGVFCTLCRESDQPALWLICNLQPRSLSRLPCPLSMHQLRGSMFHVRRTICYSWNAGKCHFPGTTNFLTNFLDLGHERSATDYNYD